MIKIGRAFGLARAFEAFFQNSRGNVVTTFALSLLPMVGAVGAAVDYSQSSSIRTAMQAAADAASLSTIKSAASLNPAQIQSTASGFFNASFARPNVSPAVTATYDLAGNVVTVTATAAVKPSFMTMVGISNVSMSVTSKATIGAKQWQVCVLVTEPTDNHTLMTKNGAKIRFDNCMVQVNTANWDAVEARDVSSIHSTNGENCFVGDIHYGDIKPPKNPTCTFFPDPFDSYQAPASNCTYTNFNVQNGGPNLSPGTYCGGILVNANATFSPGTYIIKDGKFQIVGNSNVTANGATFVLAGSNAYLAFNTSGTITMSPATTGQFAGFQFYYDDPNVVSGKKKGNKKGQTSSISGGKMTSSGVFYLEGQKFVVEGGADVTIKPGSIIADYILPDGGDLNLTGDIKSSLAALKSMQKTGIGTTGPILIR